MIGMLMGINGAKGISLNIKSIRVMIDESSIRF